MRARGLLYGLVGALLVAAAGPALALGIPGYTLSIQANGETLDIPFLQSKSAVAWTACPPTCTPGQSNGGTYNLTKSITDPAATPAFTLDGWSSGVDIDPFVTNNINVTNISALPQTFDITVTLPISPAVSSPSTLTGSVGITLTNTTGGVSLTDAGTAVYTALIDGSPVQTLKNPSYTLTCSPVTDFCSVTDSAGFGPTGGGPAATSTIGIRLHFTLSPGDSAGLTSVFNVVPEPMTVLMMGLGLIGLGVAGRSRA
jgi:hypothetical protein